MLGAMLSLLQLQEWPHGQRIALSLIEGHSRLAVTYDELRRRALALSDYLIEQHIDYGDCPIAFRSAGAMKRMNETIHDTGLPGRPK